MHSFESKTILGILTLDNGGGKRFYTLGVLKEIGATVGCLLREKFNFYMSTSVIIASLIVLGYHVGFLLDLYRQRLC